MSLQIDLQAESSTYHPGSTISGSVLLISNSSESISAVDISFQGRSKVKLRSSEHYTTRSYRSTAVYVREEQTLYNGGNFTHKPGTYSWPFVFQIPEYSQQQSSIPSRPKRQLDSMGMLKLDKDARPTHDFFTARSPWRGSQDLRPHALVESFSYTHSRWPLFWECRIEYSLLATLRRPPGSFLFRSKDLEAKKSVTIRCLLPKDIATLVQKRKTIELSQNLTSTRRVLPRARDGTHSLFRPANKTTRSINVSISTATYIIPGTNLQFFIRASKSEQTGNDGESAKIKLLGVNVYILMTTAVRDNALTALEQTAEEIEAITIASNKNLQIDLPEASSDPVDVGGVLAARFPLELASSFSTYNIQRGYRLGFELKLSYQGNVVMVSENSINMIVVSAGDEANRGIESYGQIEGDTSHTGDIVASLPTPLDEKKDGAIGNDPHSTNEEEEEDQLPAYQP